MANDTRYYVEAAFIHQHKDCTGEYLDGLTYEEALKIQREWNADKVHKNVILAKQEIPFPSQYQPAKGENHG